MFDYLSDEKWNRTITEMGLKKFARARGDLGFFRYPLTMNATIAGVYRNHRVTVSEIKYPDDNETSYDSFYDVEFKNPKELRIYIQNQSIGWRISSHGSIYDSLQERLLKGEMIVLKLGDALFDREYEVRGDREHYLPIILDQSIRHKIMSVKYPPFNLLIELIGLIDGEYLYRARHHVYNREGDAQRFRLVVDTMVDIVERIEAGVSFEDMPQISSRMEEERKLKAEQLRLLARTNLHAAILGILDNNYGIMAKEIGDELRGMGLAIENIDVIQALSKLVKEGKVIKVQGSDRNATDRGIRYYKE